MLSAKIMIYNKNMGRFTTIKEYIAAQPKIAQPLLREMYATIQSVAPKATEDIEYGMPTFVGNKNSVHFAGAKEHLAFYPVPSAITHFKKELTKYKT